MGAPGLRTKGNAELRFYTYALVLLGFAVHAGVALTDDVTPSPGHRQKNKYVFGEDWFSQNIPKWDKNLADLKGKPGIRYLEIGPYEGRSFLWVLDNVLTHPTSRGTAIDIFQAEPGTVYKEGYEFRFRSNLDLSGARERVEVIKGSSQVEMRKLPLESFDLIYVDGSHAANDVLADAVLAWSLLEPGGVIIFDDYGAWNTNWPRRLRPAFAINSFVTAYDKEIEVIDRSYQLVLRKRMDRCLRIGHAGCSYLGAYLYDWRRRVLYHSDSLEEVRLTDAERALTERLIKSQPFGQARIMTGEQLKQNPDFAVIIRKLDLDQP
jgi:SAM-dependent methyltransferase